MRFLSNIIYIKTTSSNGLFKTCNPVDHVGCDCWSLGLLEIAWIDGRCLLQVLPSAEGEGVPDKEPSADSQLEEK